MSFFFEASLISKTMPEYSKPDSPEVPLVAASSAPLIPKESLSVIAKNELSTVSSSQVTRELDSITKARLRRAERFGIPPRESEKAALRAARFGIELKSLHSTNKKVLNDSKPLKPCFLFQATQSCDKGDSCKFSHPEEVTAEEKVIASEKVAEVYILATLPQFRLCKFKYSRQFCLCYCYYCNYIYYFLL